MKAIQTYHGGTISIEKIQGREVVTATVGGREYAACSIADARRKIDQHRR